jgi:hypothetical protein
VSFSKAIKQVNFVFQNSIRHNLSLHNRFMRVQNEGTGKSSWWMINPDAKPGKSARRRATSMETSKFEKRRGRVKKKVEALRNGLQAATDATPSPSSSISEGLDMFPGSPAVATASFQLSPDFRPRASSNASSCGRMSPFHSVPVDAEWASYSAAPGGICVSGFLLFCLLVSLAQFVTIDRNLGAWISVVLFYTSYLSSSSASSTSYSSSSLASSSSSSSSSYFSVFSK